MTEEVPTVVPSSPPTAPPASRSNAVALWVLVAIVAVAAVYFVATDYERHRERTPQEKRQQEGKEAGERMEKILRGQATDKVLNGSFTQEQYQKRMRELDAIYKR